MYRRNISHILYPVACLIGLFIVYQAWFKPTYLPTSPPAQPNAVVEESQGAPPEPHHDGLPDQETTHTRLIDASVVPETSGIDVLTGCPTTVAVGSVAAVRKPSAFVAVTRMRIRKPTSARPSR